MPTWLGIDVGTVAVKIAVVKSTYRKSQIAALAIADVAESGGVVEALRRAAHAAFGAKGPAADSVSVGFPGARTGLRTLSLPASAQRQIAEVLQYELEAQVPFDMENSVFDYKLLPRRGPATGDQRLQLLTAVAPTEEVRGRIELVKEATGLEPERVAVGAFPLANLVPTVPALGEEGPVLLIDLGAKNTDAVFLQAGEPIFARTLSLGTQGLPGNANDIANEIRITMNAFRAQGGETPTRVLLCGGGAFASEAASFLSAELNRLPVEVLAPVGLDTTLVNPQRVAELPRFAKAIGLALGAGRGTGLNLRKGPLVYERGFAWVREKVPVLAGLAAVLLVSLVFAFWSRMHAVSTERETLEAALRSVTKDVLGKELDNAADVETALASATGQNEEDPLPHVDPFDVMVKLSEDIPPSMKHDVEDLVVEKGHVVLHGITGTIADVQQIKTSLKGERCFQSVKAPRTVPQVNTDRIKYTIEFELKCPEEMEKKKKSDSAGASAGGSK